MKKLTVLLLVILLFAGAAQPQRKAKPRRKTKNCEYVLRRYMGSTCVTVNDRYLDRWLGKPLRCVKSPRGHPPCE